MAGLVVDMRRSHCALYPTLRLAPIDEQSTISILTAGCTLEVPEVEPRRIYFEELLGSLRNHSAGSTY